ncbi:YppE family protein [Peribacillus glennii]|uniref:DUF1798 family protein n=1 Tax=Peribacillus glennii TaxID=2303991 RepID=A0A372LGT1_9BACI|nr:YppE family protein [Peribacillus glennii]RFU65501.1 DUF1798 family protein [Peribacillus glennii]
MKDKEIALELTKKLISLCETADRIYEDVRETGKERDFYTEVKPFADEVHHTTTEWAGQMKKWMKAESFRYIFPQQIDQTAQNLTDIAVQAFFPKTSYNRFKSHVQSVQFILKSVLTEITNPIN